MSLSGAWSNFLGGSRVATWGGGAFVLLILIYLVFFRSDDVNVAKKELAAVVRMGNKGDVDGLKKAFGSSDPEVASAAVVQMVKVQGKDARPFVEQALGHPNAQVRSAAALQMGKAGDPGNTGALETALKDPSADVRRDALKALGELKAVGAVEAVLAVFESDEDQMVQAGALNAVEAILGVRYSTRPGSPRAERRATASNIRRMLPKDKKPPEGGGAGDGR